jgi:glucose-6-phosphate-specific signal transduction histidine kinase
LKSALIQCSVFTLAHSVTLGLTAVGYILPNPKFIEPIIAISILVASIENLFHHKVNTWRLLIIFIFGLIHGMGFANALKEVGLQPKHFLASLLSFNVGVELAQITVILVAYFLIAKWWSKKDFYYTKIVYPISSLIACVALYWTVERILS